MKWSIRKLLLPGVGAVALVVAVVLIQTNAHIAYPLDTWRMDLDDALVGIGTITLGVAAIWTVWLKAQEADRKAEELAKQLNGGLQRAARQHMQENEVIIGLNHRMDRFEQERDECREELAGLKSWVIQRLDDNGAGRNQPR